MDDCAVCVYDYNCDPSDEREESLSIEKVHINHRLKYLLSLKTRTVRYDLEEIEYHLLSMISKYAVVAGLSGYSSKKLTP